MKKDNVFKSSFTGVALIFAIAIISAACSKPADNSTPMGNGGTPGKPVPGPNEVFIENQAFNPSTITVAANTTIKWTNKDGMAHTVTSSTGVFDSGSISNGGTFSFTFPAAGTYSYFCTLHTSMTGSVKVN